MDELNGLWSFTQVAGAGSFSAAAERLGLSTAALSKSVARLETRLGMRLLTRTTRALHLTPEGRHLFERVGESFAAIEQSLLQVRQLNVAPEGTVRLSTVSAYGRHAILPVLPEFFARYPLIDLEMSFHDRARGLTRQSFDVRISWGEQRERDKVAKRLCRLPLILVASPAYLERCGTPAKPQELERHQCINVDLPAGARARWIFKSRRRGGGDSYSITPRGRLLVLNELAAVIDAALAGLGLTVVTMDGVVEQLRDGALVQVLPDYAISAHNEKHSDIIIQYPQRKQMAPRVRALVDFLIEKLQVDV